MTRTTSILDRAPLAAALFLAFTVAPLLGQPAGSTHLDLSGYWELRYDSMSVPPALLAIPATAELAQTEARHDLEAIRWCNNLGVPFIMGDRGPLDIRQSPALLQWSPGFNPPRAISTPTDVSIPTKMMSSLLRTGTRLATGRGMPWWSIPSASMISAPPGYLEAVSARRFHTWWRYRLLNGGARLSAVFTWEDPKMFQKPHTYEFRYYRIPRIDGPRILACDARDQERGRFLLGPGGDR